MADTRSPPPRSDFSATLSTQLSGIATGYLTETYVSGIDNSPQPFALWVPPAYSVRRKYPLLVALHGSDDDERMIPERCFRIPQLGFRDDMIALFPFGRGETDFRWMGEADLWDTMDWVKQRYRVDDRRQYLTGFSMGGFSTWRLAADHPDQWAAIAPVCGGGDPKLLPSLGVMPVWCVHGAKDNIVPVARAREMVAELNRLGGSCRYTELADWGHHSWEWLYDPRRADGGLPAWFLEHRRPDSPRAVSRPSRTGSFMDLFSEPLVISHATATPLGRESELLKHEANRLARFTHGDFTMKSGRLTVKPDHEVTAPELKNCNHLMLGRSDNHLWLKKVERQLAARHRRGVLTVAKETYLGKSLVVLACQPSPWNKRRLLGVATYQQFHQMRCLTHAILDAPLELRRTNIYEAQQKRFILRQD